MRIDKSFLKSLKTNKYLEYLPDVKQKKTERFLNLTLTLVIISFLGFFAINPTLSTIAQLKKQLADNLQVEKSLEEKINNLSLLQQQYLLLSSNIPVVMSALPNHPESALLLAQIQSIAKTNNVRLINLQTFPVEIAKINNELGREEKPENYYSYSFSLTIQGSYKNLNDFINSLISFERIVKIENLSFIKNTDNFNELKLSLKGQAYFKE